MHHSFRIDSSADGQLGCLCPGYYKQCCDEHWGTCVSFNSGFLDVYAQQWDCWVIRSDQSLSRVRLFATPCTAARQASLSITNSQSPPKLMSIESVMSSNQLILCHPLLFLPLIPPSIRVSSNESTLRMRRPKYCVSALASFPPKKSQG